MVLTIIVKNHKSYTYCKRYFTNLFYDFDKFFFVGQLRLNTANAEVTNTSPSCLSMMPANSIGNVSTSQTPLRIYTMDGEPRKSTRVKKQNNKYFNLIIPVRQYEMNNLNIHRYRL